MKETKVNISQIKQREYELRAEADAIKARFAEYEAKGSPEWMGKSIDRDMAEWTAEWKKVEAERKKHEHGQEFIKRIGSNPAGQGSAPEIHLPLGSKALGAQAFPLGLPKQELAEAFKAIKRGQSYAIEAKSYSTVTSLLPAQLAPGIVPEYHEHRLLDHLPVTSISAPSFEFIIHTFGSDSGGPSWVSEGSAKNEYVPAANKTIVTAEKLAVHTGITSESISDAPQWQSYVINQCYRLIMDLENTALLYGSGTSNQILGLANTSGILTHDHSGDSGSVTNLDAIEMAINTLRIQSGYCARVKSRAGLVRIVPERR